MKVFIVADHHDSQVSALEWSKSVNGAHNVIIISDEWEMENLLSDTSSGTQTDIILASTRLAIGHLWRKRAHPWGEAQANLIGAVLMLGEKLDCPVVIVKDTGPASWSDCIDRLQQLPK